MRTELLILRTRVRAATNGVRTEARALVSWGAVAVAFVVAVPLAARWLDARTAGWPAVGPRGGDAKLRDVLAYCWAACAAAGAMSGFVDGIASRWARLLAALPIPDAPRFRALALQALAGRGGVLVAGCSATLAWAARGDGGALPWATATLLGGVASVALGTGAATAGALALFAKGRARLLGVVGSALVGGTIALAGFAAHRSPGNGAWIGTLMLVCAAAALVGPAARRAGSALLAAAVRSEGGGGASRRSRSLVAEHVLSLWRTPAGALLYRGYLARRRNPFTYVRVVLLATAIVAFPGVARAAALDARLSVPFVVAYALGATHLLLHEVTVQALAGEGSRLALLLRAPVSRTHLLAAKLAAALLPLLALSSGLTWLLGRLGHLSGDALVSALAASATITVAATAFLVFGSAIDADLERPVDSYVEAVLADDAPVAPKRLAIMLLAAVLQAGALLLTVGRPPSTWLPVLLVVDVVVIVVMLLVARSRLGALIRAGGRRDRPPEISPSGARP